MGGDGVSRRLADRVAGPGDRVGEDAVEDVEDRDIFALADPDGLSVRIGFVGKYVEYGDSYKSLNEALVHGGIANNVKVRIVYIGSEKLEEEGYHGELANVDGILVGPGFGARGVEGKLRAIRYAREKKIPYFGMCLGMQGATIEFARNVVGMVGANSTEISEVPSREREVIARSPSTPASRSSINCVMRLSITGAAAPG